MNTAEEPALNRRTRAGRRTTSVTALIALTANTAHEFLSEKAFSIVWATILCTHLVLGIARLGVASIHVALADPDAYASVTMIQIPRQVLMATGWSMGAISVVHFVSAFATVTFSWRAKKLVFWNTRRSTQSHLHTITAFDDGSQTPVSESVIAPTKVCAVLLAVWRHLVHVADVGTAQLDAVFGVDGFVGVNGPFFLVFFDGLKFIEVVTQTYQAYRLSELVVGRPLNAFVVAMLLVNGTLPPITEHLARHLKRTTQRLLIVVVDLALDLVYAEALPVVVLLPIVTKFDWSIPGFPAEISFNAVWSNNAVAQTRFVLVTSYMDLATTLVPHVNFILGLQMLKSLLHHRADVRDVAKALYVVKPATLKAKPRRRQRVLAQWWSQVFRVGLFLWGLAVLVLHIHSQTQHTTLPGCEAALTPWRIWRANTTPCAVMTVDCHRRGLRGDADDIDRVLQQLDRNVVSTVVFTHCAALVVPAVVATFSRLVAVEFFNNTLVQWGPDAAITRTRHRLLHHVFFFETNMTAMPEAIVHGELPWTLQYVAVHTSNLSQLSEAIGPAWSASDNNTGGRRRFWRVISFINTALRDLPASFGLVRIDTLQLINNSMPRLPDGVIHSMADYAKLRVSGPNFLELPAQIHGGPQPRLRRLYIEHSSVAALPAWLTTWLDTPNTAALPPFHQVSLHGSHVCDKPEYAQYASRFCRADTAFDIDAIPLDAIRRQWAL